MIKYISPKVQIIEHSVGQLDGSIEKITKDALSRFTNTVNTAENRYRLEKEITQTINHFINQKVLRPFPDENFIVDINHEKEKAELRTKIAKLEETLLEDEGDLDFSLLDEMDGYVLRLAEINDTEPTSISVNFKHPITFNEVTFLTSQPAELGIERGIDMNMKDYKGK